MYWQWIFSTFIWKSLNFTFIFKGYVSWRILSFRVISCTLKIAPLSNSFRKRWIVSEKMSAVIFKLNSFALILLPVFKFFSSVLLSLVIWFDVRWYDFLHISSVHWGSWIYEFIVFTGIGKYSLTKSLNIFSDLCSPSLHLGYNYTYIC